MQCGGSLAVTRTIPKHRIPIDAHPLQLKPLRVCVTHDTIRADMYQPPAGVLLLPAGKLKGENHEVQDNTPPPLLN